MKRNAIFLLGVGKNVMEWKEQEMIFKESKKDKKKWIEMIRNEKD